MLWSTSNAIVVQKDIAVYFSNLSNKNILITFPSYALILMFIFRVVAWRLQGGCEEVGGWLRKVAGTIWSHGGFGCCKWNLSATKLIVERLLVVADRLPTGRWLVSDWSPTSCSGCRQSDTVFSRRLIANQSPIGCQPISKMLQTFCNHKQTLKIQSLNSRRLITNRLPIAPQLIADWSPTDRQTLSDYTTV